MRKATLVLAPVVSCAAGALIVSCANITIVTLPGTSYLYAASGAAANLPQPTLTGYTIAADGFLTPLSCVSLANAQLLALTAGRSLLFTSAQPSGSASSVIATYSIAHDGCLTLSSTTDVTARGAPLSLFLDRQGDALYSWVMPDAGASDWNSYSMDGSSGALKFTGEIGAGVPTYLRSAGISALPAGMLAFTSDDSFAVSSTWNYLNSTGIEVYRRSAGGALEPSNIFAPSPIGDGYYFFTGFGAAADDNGHIIVAGLMCADYSSTCVDKIRLAVYTFDSQRHLTTQSNPETMATPPSSGYISGYAFSPDCHYFAVASGGGIDVYQWDAATASLHYLDSITLQGNGFSGEILQAFTWDRYDHLIFASEERPTDGELPDTGLIQVYSVTPSGVVPARGSPYPLRYPHLLTAVNIPLRSPF